MYLKQNFRRMRLNILLKRVLERKYYLNLLYGNISSVRLDLVSMDEPHIRVTDFLSRVSRKGTSL